jgi:hypothetical protein
MKKILVIISAVIVAAACAAPPTNREAAPANANVATAPSPAAVTEADAIAKEKAVWDTIKNKDYEAFGNMLDEGQVEVTGEAVNDKAASIANVKVFEPSDVNFSDWKFLSIDKDAFVVSYTVSYKGKYKGKDFPPESAHASSAWVNRAGKWLAKYHQECPVKAAMPPPARPAEKAKAAAPPAASPVMAAAGPDPIANEKMIWDFLKNKNYDAFAANLASDAIEVEPDGVFDKAGSVKGVSQVDLSKAVVSDFQSVKLDDDASLVVYMVKTPGGLAPNGARHATIWANRAGKWLAVFHHGGTPVTKPGAMPETKPAAAPSPTKSASPVVKPPMKKT